MFQSGMNCRRRGGSLLAIRSRFCAECGDALYIIKVSAMSAFLKIIQKKRLVSRVHVGAAAPEVLQSFDIERKGAMAKRLPLR